MVIISPENGIILHWNTLAPKIFELYNKTLSLIVPFKGSFDRGTEP